MRNRILHAKKQKDTKKPRLPVLMSVMVDKKESDTADLPEDIGIKNVKLHNHSSLADFEKVISCYNTYIEKNTQQNNEQLLINTRVLRK